MKQLLKNHSFVLTEASVVERLRRSEDVHLHETLVNAPLIYDGQAGETMGAIYQEYMELAERADLPILLCTPTWRTNQARVMASGICISINQDAVAYMQALRSDPERVKIGGLIGCKHDCYRPEEGLSAAESQSFHAWQIEQLVEGGVDFLIAETLPHVPEALGIAKAMEATSVPYIISFVISRDGCVLDGTPLGEAFAVIDSGTENKPLGYMINCAHPSFLCPDKQAGEPFSRLIGYQANASSLDHCDLDAADEVMVDSVSEWGKLMLNLNKRYGIKILGGCCGTDARHLQYLIQNRAT